ncbi:MAG TPA: NRDE family protein [Rhodocyclaceae bacterium]|nr:NRDE family protein [Rhodocyclaceae bacterium]
MCLVLVAWRAHPDYPLVVAANRDEFFARPTAAASFWPDSDILAGRDLKEGGTWMGITRGRRFAALTNFRAPERHRDGLASRGRLVADFLAAKEEPMPWLQALASRTTEYNDFNLIVSDGETLACLASITGDIRLLEPGVHGLSNHFLDTPWPKVQAAKSALSDALVALPDDAPLLELLRDDSIHPDEALPRTGVSLEWERLLSAAFVRAPDYGTRSSTILLIGADRTLTFDEQTWLEGGRPGGRARFRFRPAAS